MRYVSILLLLLLLLGCSDSISEGNGSETTNGYIAVVDSSMNPVVNARVTIFASDFNPITDDSTDGYFTAITNDSGVASFNITTNGTYNVVSRKDSSLIGFDKGISFEGRDTLRKQVIVSSQKGDIDMFLPETLDTTASHLYIEGSDFTNEFDTSLVVAGGYRVVTLRGLPATTLSAVRFYDGDDTPVEIKILDTVKIERDSVLSVALTPYDNVKPVWSFSLAIFVHQDVISDLGGTTQSEEIIHNYFNTSLDRINRHEHFDGVFHFSIDTIGVYSGTMEEEADKPLDTHFDYRIIFGNKLSARASQLQRAQSYFVYNSVSSTLFDPILSDGLPAIFAQFRGALNLRHSNVDSVDNKLAGISYFGDTTIMNHHWSNKWDPYTIAVLNHNKDEVGNEIDFSVQAIPNSVTFDFTDNAGNKMKNCEFHLHAREWIYQTGNAIDTEPFIKGTTDENGQITISDPIFTNDNRDAIINGNVQVEIIDSDSVKHFTWLPIIEVSRAWVQGEKDSYIKKISF